MLNKYILSIIILLTSLIVSCENKGTDAVKYIEEDKVFDDTLRWGNGHSKKDKLDIEFLTIDEKNKSYLNIVDTFILNVTNNYPIIISSSNHDVSLENMGKNQYLFSLKGEHKIGQSVDLIVKLDTKKIRLLVNKKLKDESGSIIRNSTFPLDTIAKLEVKIK